jgi:nitrogen regulatory protein PII
MDNNNIESNDKSNNNTNNNINNSKNKELVSIVAESAIEKSLTKEIMQLGAHGYTVLDVRGEGRRGYRSSEWAKSSNIQINVVCNPDVAKKISEHVEAKYFKDFAVTIYSTAVSVLRSDKF